MAIKNFIRRFIKDTRGATMVEYIILVGVVALISIAAFKTFGSSVQTKIGDEGTALTGMPIKLAA